MEQATIQDLLICIRKALGMAGHELARTVGVSHSYVQQLEKGVQTPSTDYLRGLIHVYFARSGEPIEVKKQRVRTLSQ